MTGDMFVYYTQDEENIYSSRERLFQVLLIYIETRGASMARLGHVNRDRLIEH